MAMFQTLCEMQHGEAGYQILDRQQWAKLRGNTPLSISEGDLQRFRGVIDHMDVDELEAVMLPLSRILNLHFSTTKRLGRVKERFPGLRRRSLPYVIAIVGSVAVGKSTFARVLRALLSCWSDHPNVELVATDGFLYPTSTLQKRQLMKRKGFPESYDVAKMIRFLTDIKAGVSVTSVPVYSHLAYDIVPSERQVIRAPDILILEGLNLLQIDHSAPVAASDFCDVSIYLDADETDIQQWYVERFLRLQSTAFQNPQSFFHHYKDLDDGEARSVAKSIWESINLVNLKENILPTRARADLVLRKSSDHRVKEVWLR